MHPLLLQLSSPRSLAHPFLIQKQRALFLHHYASPIPENYGCISFSPRQDWLLKSKGPFSTRHHNRKFLNDYLYHEISPGGAEPASRMEGDPEAILDCSTLSPGKCDSAQFLGELILTPAAAKMHLLLCRD